MEPMQPMQPMRPMSHGEAWWPAELGQPSTSGAQNGTRYAVFADKRRLVVEQDGKRAIYDTGDHRIGGVSQQQGDGRSLAFSSDQGPVGLETLRQL